MSYLSDYQGLLWLKKHRQTFLYIAALLIAIAPLHGTYLDLGIRREVFSLFFISGLIFLVIPAGSFLVERLLDRLAAETGYEVRPIKRKEIDTLLPLYNELIGGPRVSKQYDFTPVKIDASPDELNRIYKLKIPR